MRGVITVAVLAVTASAAALGQTKGRQITLNKAELELIALTREFVDTSISKDIVVVAGGLTPVPSGPMVTAEVRGRWESVEVEDFEARINGDEAVVTARVMFGGRLREGGAVSDSSGVRIVYAREGGQWKLRNGCLGACGGK